MLLVYVLLMLASGITDLWIFFRISQVAASKKNILSLGAVVLLLPILCGGVVELATFLEILFFIFYSPIVKSSWTLYKNKSPSGPVW